MLLEYVIVDGKKPLLCCDVWEHAYFLKHVNLREEYVNSWFQVVDWNEAESRYLCALTT